MLPELLRRLVPSITYRARSDTSVTQQVSTLIYPWLSLLSMLAALRQGGLQADSYQLQKTLTDLANGVKRGFDQQASKTHTHTSFSPTACCCHSYTYCVLLT